MLRRGQEVAEREGERGGAEKEGEGQEEEEEEYPDNVEGDDEYDEEEVYIMVDLPPAVDGEALANASTVSIKGVGTDNPQLTIDKHTFEGKTEPIVGTALIFRTPPAGSTGRNPLELECFSNMRMNFNQKGPRGRKKSRS